MYAIYGNIGGILMVNVTIYGIHGSYGSYSSFLARDFPFHDRRDVRKDSEKSAASRRVEENFDRLLAEERSKHPPCDLEGGKIRWEGERPLTSTCLYSSLYIHTYIHVYIIYVM
jgi:hypothetical protein